jgi:hypothetical protein
LRKKLPVRLLTAGLAATFGAALLAPGTAHAATCSYFSMADVGVTVKGYQCVANGLYTRVYGNLYDTKADGKTAYFGLYWFNGSGTATGSNSIKIGGSGKSVSFDWSHAASASIDKFIQAT